MREINKIILHCSATREGDDSVDVDVIDRNCFMNSRLCTDYTEHVCQLLLNKAKEHIQQGNTQEGLRFLCHATAAASTELVAPGFRTTAEFATHVFGGSFQGELELLEFLLPDEEQSKTNIKRPLRLQTTLGRGSSPSETF